MGLYVGKVGLAHLGGHFRTVTSLVEPMARWVLFVIRGQVVVRLGQGGFFGDLPLK